MLAPDRPDWRWHVVTPLLEFSSVHAAPHLQRLDRMTQRVYQFRRQFRDRLISTLPDCVNAHEVWMNRAYQRAILEGLIIGGADDEAIQEEMEIGKDDLATYIATFFDVRGRRRADVANMVFQGLPHRGYHPQDKLGTMHRLGWFGGFKLIQSVLARGLNSEEVQRFCAEICKDIVRRQMPEMGLTVGVQTQFAPEFLKIANEWDGNKTGGTTDAAEQYILDAVGVGTQEGATVSVADPTVEANLKLPAAEPHYTNL